MYFLTYMNKYVIGRNKKLKMGMKSAPETRCDVPTTVIYFREIYRAINKSLRDFRPLRYSSRDGHAEGKHVNRGRDTPIFLPTLQVFDMSSLGDAAGLQD